MSDEQTLTATSPAKSFLQEVVPILKKGCNEETLGGVIEENNFFDDVSENEYYNTEWAYYFSAWCNYCFRNIKRMPLSSSQVVDIRLPMGLQSQFSYLSRPQVNRVLEMASSYEFRLSLKEGSSDWIIFSRKSRPAP